MSGTASLPAAAPSAGAAASTCPYCANVKLLREILPPKRCDYCRQWRCQFCTLKFPLLGVRKVLPKVLKGNSRICLQCFNRHWHENGLSAGAAAPHLAKRASMPELSDLRHSQRHRGSILRDSIIDSSRRESLLIDDLWAGKESFSGRSSARLSFLDESPAPAVADAAPNGEAEAANGAPHRLAALLGLTVGSDPTGTGLISAVDLWMSLFSASILLVIALTDSLSLQQRVCFCVATYGLFLTLHPWIHTHHFASSSSSERTEEDRSAPPPPEKASAAERAQPSAAPAPSAPSTAGPIPAVYLAKKNEIEATVAHYLSPKSPWKEVRRSETCTIYELTENKSPFPIFKLEMFITNISMADFLAHLRSTSLEDRSVWDVNAANFEVVEAFDCENAGVSVCVNTQKPFLGGLVASRDFCLLYISKPDTLIFTSVEHPKVPPRPGSTRAHLFITMFTCREGRDANGTPGFTMTNIGQVDIRGSLPSRMLYKGTMDNMENVLKVFRDADKLFNRAPHA